MKSIRIDEALTLLLLEYRNAPQLATDEYAQKLGLKQRDALIQRSAEIRRDFAKFHAESPEFMQRLRERAGDETDRAIAFATREYRALGYALMFDAEPEPDQTSLKADVATIEEDEAIDEDIEILGR